MKYINPISNEEVWLRSRKLGIGASDASCLFGWNPWKSLHKLFLEKTGQQEDEFKPTRFSHWGSTLEPVILQHYAWEVGEPVLGRDLHGRPVVFHPERTKPPTMARKSNVPDVWLLNPLQSPVHPWMRVNYDGFLLDENMRVKGFLEVKTTHARNKKKWDGSIPPAYYAQLMHQHQVLLDFDMDLPGAIMVLIGGNDFGHTEYRDRPHLRKEMVRRGEIFWDGVTKMLPPSPSVFYPLEEEFDMVFIPSPKRTPIPPHPEGWFPAVLCDVVDHGIETFKWNDEPKQAHKISLHFFTDQVFEATEKHPVTGEDVEVPENLVGQPRKILEKFTASLSENANLRKFLNQWFGRNLPPEIEENGLDPDSLIGRPAYINVSLRETKNGGYWANINAIGQPPAGITVPEIPSDYVRIQDREDEEEESAPSAKSTPSAPPAAKAALDLDDDPLPF